MSNLYSVFPSLTPDTKDILEAELLAKQILEAKFPDLDLREGTGLRDLVLRPTAYAMALLRKASDSYFAQNSLNGVNDTTDTEIVDDILSNWFIERNLGTVAVINARLYFARAKNVTLPSSIYFSTDNSLKFFAASTQTFSASTLTYDSYQNEWYVDVDLVAETTGTEYNIGEGSLLYFANFDPYFLHAEINYLSQSSTAAETNKEFIARAETAVSTRNLINKPSVTSSLTSTFNTLTRVVSVGMGDEDMIRDQIKVIIDPEDPRLLASLSQTGGVATAILPEHGFEVGQIIDVTGAIPSGYNGRFTITDRDADSFTYSVNPALGTASIKPTVQSFTSPNLVHTGGMVDIYCGDEVSSSIVQLTTNSNGVASLVGPIYEFSRSDITGGSEDDSIPYLSNVTISSSSLDTGTKLLSVTSNPSHGLVNGQVIALSGITQSKVVTTLSCTNLVVTALSANHGLTTGDTVTISGALPVTYNGTYEVTVLNANTFTYVISANVLVPGTGTILVSNAMISGEYAVTYTGVNTFTITIPSLWTGSTDDISGLNISHSVAYSVVNPNLQTKTVYSLTGTGTTATAVLENHGYAKNRYVTISGATPSYYNGTWKITEVQSATTFTFSIDDAILAPATGTITSQYIVPWNDVGFSNRQALNIDFGTAHANKTASFDVKYFTEVDSVQAYLESDDTHVLCGDYLARGFNIYVIDVNVVVYNGPAPTTGTVASAVNTYLTSLVPGDTLVLSDLGAALNDAGVVNIQTPIGVSYKYYHRDLVAPKTGTVVDYLDPLDKTNVFILGEVTTDSLSV